MTTSLGARLRASARELGDAVAVRSVRAVDEVREISWAELDRRSDAVAAALLDAGVEERPATVVLLTRDAVEHAVHAYGAWKAGQTVLCLSPGLGSDEAANVFAKLDRTVSFGERPAWDTSEHVEVPSIEPGRELPDAVADPMMIIASGGSTGMPKLIDAIGPGAFTPGVFLGGLGQAMKREARMAALVCTPLSHGAGAATAYLHLFEQCELTALERFKPDTALWAIERFGSEHVTVVPTMMDRMLRSPGWDPARLRSVRALVHTGGVIDPAVKRAMIDAVGPEAVIEIYGSTESLGHAVIRGDEWLEHPGSVGRPLNCDVVILDPEGQELPRGEVGEVYMRPHDRGIDPSKKYVGEAPPLRSHGEHVSVGDLGYLDDDGYLYIVGRTDDLIITGGANVYPDEVEIVLRRLGGISDCVVVGRPHEDLGEAVHAVIAMEAGVAPPTLEQLHAQLDGRLARYKMPRSLEVVDALERTDAGKLRRRSFRPSDPANR